jgi:hypothetical protein
MGRGALGHTEDPYLQGQVYGVCLKTGTVKHFTNTAENMEVVKAVVQVEE